MSSAISGRGAAAAEPLPRSAPVARVAHGVLSANARIASAVGARCYSSSLLAGDAWGHGAELVREVLVAEGFAPASADAAEGELVDPRTLFGIPGGSPQAAPVLRLFGTVLSVKTLRYGEGVSYGYAYRASRDTRVALVTGGYAQGIVRALGNAADVAIAGARHPIVGRVAMDVCVVDVGDAAVQRGDEALFLGDARRGEPSLADWADATGLTPAELITTVGLRALREVVS